MACTTCNQPDPCNCCPPPYTPNPTGCLSLINSNCITYSGNTIDCADISTGQTLNQVIEELAGALCDLSAEFETFNSFDCDDLNGCSINDLGDVVTPAPVSGDVLIFNGTNWVNETLDICSELDNCSIDALGDVIITAPASGDVLVFNGSEWVNASNPPYSFQCSDLNGCALIDLGDVSDLAEFSGNVLIYNGADWVGIQLPEVAGFSCTDLSGCSISSLADVDTTGAVSGDILIFNGTTWVDAHSEVITEPLQIQIDILNSTLIYQQTQINNILAKLECFCISGVDLCCATPTGECSALTFTDTTITSVCYNQPGSIQGKLVITGFNPTFGGDIASVAGVTGVYLFTDNAFQYVPIIPTDALPYSDILTMSSALTTSVKNGDSLTAIIYMQFTDTCGAGHTAGFTFTIGAWSPSDENVCYASVLTTYEIDPV